MGPTLSLFLSVLGALIDSGDLTSWSIGGTPPPGVGSILGQQGHGLIGSHNKYENDVSPTRPDLYESGNNYLTQAQQFQDMIDASPGGLITLDTLAEYRSQRFDRQVANNPYFFNAPFPGLLVQPAAFTFIYRFMANHTAENPHGILTYDTVQTWFGAQGVSWQSSPCIFAQTESRFPTVTHSWTTAPQVANQTLLTPLIGLLCRRRAHPSFLPQSRQRAFLSRFSLFLAAKA